MLSSRPQHSTPAADSNFVLAVSRWRRMLWPTRQHLRSLLIRLFHLQLISHIEANQRRERRAFIRIYFSDDVATHRLRKPFRIASPSPVPPGCRLSVDAPCSNSPNTPDRRTRAAIQCPLSVILIAILHRPPVCGSANAISDPDATFIGEFHRIRPKIENDLANARLIAAHPFRTSFVTVEVNDSRFAAAPGAKSCMACATQVSEKRLCLRGQAGRSILEKSRMSSIKARRARAKSSTMRTHVLCSASSGKSRIGPTIPRIPFIGVRIS